MTAVVLTQIARAKGRKRRKPGNKYPANLIIRILHFRRDGHVESTHNNFKRSNLMLKKKLLTLLLGYKNTEILQNAKLNMYNFGVHLREVYGDFLGNLYFSNIMKMRTTEYTLSMLSAQLVNAGLWPPSNSQMWMEDFNWQPIPSG